MPPTGESLRTQRARKSEAADWFARMRGPDAEKVQLEFERWRASDPRNRAAYARLDDLWRASAGLAGTEMGRAPIFTPRPSIFAIGGARLAFASLALLVAVVTGAFLLSRHGAAPPPLVAQGASTLGTGVGEIRVLRLADGSTVTLDTDSAVEVAMTDSSRLVRLTRGRARFDVARDGARPFTVQADGKTVTSRGTLFDVAYCREGVRVTLLRGVVDVRDVATASGVPPPAARLVAGQALVGVAGGPPRITAAGADQWVSGMLSFDGAPLSNVIDEANRYSRNKLRLASPELARLRVSGVFKALPTKALAASLAAAFDLRVDRAANGDFVLRARYSDAE